MLDNLKDYAVRALVNAIDHLGTVAYKLGDMVEQQTLDISSMELKVMCLNQVAQIRFYWLLVGGVQNQTTTQNWTERSNLVQHGLIIFLVKFGSTFNNQIFILVQLGFDK